MKKKNVVNILVIIALAITIAFTYTSSNYLKKLSGNLSLKEELILNANEKKKSKIIDEYISSNKEFLIDETIFDKDYVCVVTKDKKYKSVIFDYVTGEILNYDNLIKKEFKKDFKKKIKELLDLKYPKFISSVLSEGKGSNVYYFKDNELIIYFYDYKIEPSIKEELFLKVNYNEIADYLNVEVSLDETYENEDGSKIDLNKKLIAITFDDGPGKFTEDLVDALVDNKAKSTFFMVGRNLNSNKSAVLKVYNSNMEIGYHSYNHTSFTKQSAATIKSELEKSNEILKSITSSEFSLVRPPYGSINSNAKKALDKPLILWHVDTLDWRYRDVEYLKKYTMENAKDGDIILFHDIHETSVEAVKELLPLLYAEGFQLVTVSKLAEVTNNNLENQKLYSHFTR